MELSKCKFCNGKSVGLIKNSLQLCSYCARKTKAFFDPDTNNYCKNGYFDISPYADGGILKKIIKKSSSYETIEYGCNAFVQYVGRLEDQTIFDTTRDIVDGKNVGGTDDPYEFRLGHEKVIKGWDIGVATMMKGEISSFVISSKYAYGQNGLDPKVEPNQTVMYEIELIRFGSPLPKFPSKEELAVSRKQIEEENIQQMKDNPPPTIDERVGEALKNKELGNTLVVEGKYTEAKEKYDNAFIYVYISKEESAILTEEERKKVDDIKLLLHLNRAFVKIKMDKCNDALWDCDQAILLDESNLKGHYRRAQCYLDKLNIELDKEKAGEFWIFEKALKFKSEAKTSLESAMKLCQAKDIVDKNIRRTLCDLKTSSIALSKYIKNYQKEEKKLFKEKIFDKLEQKRAKKQSSENEQILDSQYDDMPSLE